jgi:hypothetical protein
MLYFSFLSKFASVLSPLMDIQRGHSIDMVLHIGLKGSGLHLGCNADNTYRNGLDNPPAGHGFGRESLPQAGRGPALPVFFDSSLPPFPRSSVPA